MTAEAPHGLYQKGEKKMNHAFQLKDLDRVPGMSLFCFLNRPNYIEITSEEAMYSHEKMIET